MPDAFSIQYTGAQATATLWKEAGILYLTIGSSTTTYSLSNASYDTLTELTTVLDAVADITCTLIATGTLASTLLNDISQSHKADIKTAIYYAGYNNYTSPKKVTELMDIDAVDVKNTWLDEADSEIEERTGFKFRATTITSTNINIDGGFIYTCNDYQWSQYLYDNAYTLRDYAPVTTLTALTIDGTAVTVTYAIVEHDQIILTSDAETTVWVPGRAKATVTLTYGYATTTKEGIMASEYCTYYVGLKYLGVEHRDQVNEGSADTIHHASVVLETGNAQAEENGLRREWMERMNYLSSKLQKTIYRVS